MATQEQITQFINKISPVIANECKARGYLFPSAIIAQACCESAYGTSMLGYKYHNYFGMKCGSAWKGKSVNLRTKEEINSSLISIRDNFRVYDNVEAGIKGYFDFISSSRYQNLKNATSSLNYLELIKADGYATSSSYVNTVYKIVNTYNLTQYDIDHSKPVIKPVDVDIVRKVLHGEMGNGAARRQNIVAAGYVYEEVQRKVNEVVTIAETIHHLKKELGDFFPLTLEI